MVLWSQPGCSAGNTCCSGICTKRPQSGSWYLSIGQPRVGDEDFAAGFDAALAEKCFRFVNNNDVVTQNPLPGLVFKYAHVGQKLYIDSNGILRSTIPWWKKLWDQWNGMELR
ncbi:lipase family protein [Bathymodiolus japonicus methanotrophic gill symbiont]|uniref:lipase family protein n=1 Tax=Bathymodiolus japonicus methanotrophic gill symbiont TaxID=113269 RepID=UPI003B82E608